MRCSRAPACRASTGNAAATAAAAAAAAGRGGGAVVASSASFQVGLVACKTRNTNRHEPPKESASKCTRGLPCTSSILLCLVRQCCCCCCCRCSWSWWRCGCD
ncbi:hypothetical protein PR003_g31149 [Phytophthora rubi]|uniref:Uncharacterized protein n=1 Tax=Phytophthora rubi TaxID=129364 RepID=A0A6A3G1N3_9STRA|nr:hypothetical protein PR002_g32686 [Phytophthora rubi]KAE8958633.1 hypothetical protein PR001_g30988 [Phytophthora rubi]KAE9269420.1 hypothetical protein PR003_g31149 [Phytophthora rubi]